AHRAGKPSGALQEMLAALRVGQLLSLLAQALGEAGKQIGIGRVAGRPFEDDASVGDDRALALAEILVGPAAALVEDPLRESLAAILLEDAAAGGQSQVGERRALQLS